MLEMNAKFLDLVKDLPNLWRQKHEAEMSSLMFPKQSQGTEFATDISAVAVESASDSSVSSQPPAVVETKASTNQPPAAVSPAAVRAYVPRTPLHLLANQSTARRSPSPSPPPKSFGSINNSFIASADLDTSKFDSDGEKVHNKGKNKGIDGKTSMPWSSPSLRSSPTDQLIAAILDGDVQVSYYFCLSCIISPLLLLLADVRGYAL